MNPLKKLLRRNRPAPPRGVIDLSMGEGDPIAEVRVHLDRPRVLRFGFPEAVRYSRATGHSILRRGIDLLELEEKQLLELLAAAASRDDPEVTLATLAPHVYGDRLVSVVAALAVLIGEFMPSGALPGDLEQHIRRPPPVKAEG